VLETKIEIDLEKIKKKGTSTKPGGWIKKGKIIKY
jgi:hypothetical protein